MLIEEEYYNRYTRNCIYEAECLITNEIYIGQTQQELWKRIGNHKRCKDNAKFQIAISNYGFENFRWSIVWAHTNQNKLSYDEMEELDQKEIDYIKLYNSYHNGLNSHPGGKYSAATFKAARTKELIESRKLRAQDQWKNPEYRAKQLKTNGKIEESKAIEIIELLKQNINRECIAKQLNISLAIVSNIANGRTFKWLGYEKEPKIKVIAPKINKKLEIKKQKESSKELARQVKAEYNSPQNKEKRRQYNFSPEQQRLRAFKAWAGDDNKKTRMKQNISNRLKEYYKNLTEEDKLKRYPKKEKPPKENKMKQRKDVDLIIKTNKKPNKTKHTLEQIELTKTALSEGKTNAEIIRKYHIPRSLISDIKYHGYHATIRPDLNFAIYGKEPTVIDYISTEDIRNVKRIIDDGGTPKDIERELGVDKIKLYKQIKYQGMYKDV